MAGRRPARMAHGEALRIRVIKAVVEDGLSRNEAARIFRVGIARAIRWVSTFEETRRTAALPTGGDRRSVLKPHRDWLLELRRKENDLTLDAIAGRLLRAHGVAADPRRPADFSPRDLDDDRDDPSLRLGRRRCTRHRPCPEWSLEDDDVSCRPHLRGVDCPLCARRA